MSKDQCAAPPPPPAVRYHFCGQGPPMASESWFCYCRFWCFGVAREFSLAQGCLQRALQRTCKVPLHGVDGQQHILSQRGTRYCTFTIQVTISRFCIPISLFEASCNRSGGGPLCQCASRSFMLSAHATLIGTGVPQPRSPQGGSNTVIWCPFFRNAGTGEGTPSHPAAPLPPPLDCTTPNSKCRSAGDGGSVM